MQRVPMVGDERDLAVGGRQVQRRVFGVENILHVITQGLHRLDRDDGLEVLAVYLGLAGLHGDALARQMIVGAGRKAGHGNGRRDGGPGEKSLHTGLLLPFCGTYEHGMSMIGKHVGSCDPAGPEHALPWAFHDDGELSRRAFLAAARFSRLLNLTNVFYCNLLIQMEVGS